MFKPIYTRIALALLVVLGTACSQATSSSSNSSSSTTVTVGSFEFTMSFPVAADEKKPVLKLDVRDKNNSNAFRSIKKISAYVKVTPAAYDSGNGVKGGKAFIKHGLDSPSSSSDGYKIYSEGSWTSLTSNTWTQIEYDAGAGFTDCAEVGLSLYGDPNQNTLSNVKLYVDDVVATLADNSTITVNFDTAGSLLSNGSTIVTSGNDGSSGTITSQRVTTEGR